MLDNFITEINKVICLFCQFQSLICSSFCNGKNGTFLWLHNCLIRSLYRFLESITQNSYIYLFVSGNDFAEATKQLG